MNKFSYLHWLWKKDKDLCIPEIIIGNNSQISGCYYHPTRDQILLSDEIVDLSKGVIFIDESNIINEEHFSQTLAHEWRHHWQYFNTCEYYECPFIFDDCDYYECIVRFFKYNYYELDALLFELKSHPPSSDSYLNGWLDELSKANVYKKDMEFILS